MTDPAVAVDPVNRSVEVVEGFARLWAGKWIILMCVLVSAGGFAAAAFLMTPFYRASTVLAPAGRERAGLGGMLSSALGSLGGLASLAGFSGGQRQDNTDESIAVLKSRQFTEQFITERNVMPVLFPDKWDSAAGKWRVPQDQLPSIASAVKYFQREILTVTQDKKTALVTVQIECQNPIAAADWANDLVKRLNAWMRAKAVASSDASVAFLRKEMDSATTVEARAAVGRLMEAQINQRMISNVTEEFAFRVIDPAYAPDRGDRARPKRMLMILFGILVGGVLGSAVVVLRDLPRTTGPRPS